MQFSLRPNVTEPEVQQAAQMRLWCGVTHAVYVYKWPAGGSGAPALSLVCQEKKKTHSRFIVSLTPLRAGVEGGGVFFLTLFPQVQ